VRNVLEVDVHIIRQEGLSLMRPSLMDEISYYSSKSGYIIYWYTFCLMSGVSAVSALLNNFIGYRTVGFLFLLFVIIVGMFGSIGAVVLAAT
jgi:two-component system sensor histidine kinase KdpD